MRRHYNTIKTAKNKETERHCRDCANSYDYWHSPAMTDGHMILGRCPHTGCNGRYSILLSQNAGCCEYFIQRRIKEGGCND